MMDVVVLSPGVGMWTLPTCESGWEEVRPPFQPDDDGLLVTVGAQIEDSRLLPLTIFADGRVIATITKSQAGEFRYFRCAQQQACQRNAACS